MARFHSLHLAMQIKGLEEGLYKREELRLPGYRLTGTLCETRQNATLDCHKHQPAATKMLWVLHGSFPVYYLLNHMFLFAKYGHEKE